MRIVTAPQTYRKPRTLFLAGGITGCPNWQNEFINKLSEAWTRIDPSQVVLFNPRRDDFNIKDRSATHEQIKWEYQKLAEADAHLFWFPKETLCPITLFELGKVLMWNKPLFIGTEPGYGRSEDVFEQLQLVRPNKPVEKSLDMLVSQVYCWYKEANGE